jgi:hypothetical protein
VFNGLFMTAKDTLCTFLPVTVCKVVLGEDYSSTKIPHKHLSF